MLHTFLGDLLRDNRREQEPAKPLLEYRHAIETDCYGWAHNNLGQIWRQGKNNDAITEFEKATTCDPKDETPIEAVEQALLPQQASASTTGQAVAVYSDRVKER